MLRTVEAVLNRDGTIHLLDEIAVDTPRRALVTILTEPPAKVSGLEPSNLRDDWEGRLDSAVMDAYAAERDPTLTLDQVRNALGTIQGSMDEAIDAGRGEF